ncbi:hypothetical protein BDB00DRAFT_974372 [Zychaea mexicana]|uniref:uncharacterized protein n=1 Tax=Zychaea mexicana TaxID=64656 RepID=UPI0022FE80CD|nr:uncharacterized protein BDB00DRAFT_974372 [Zychaea mexicana]KAI9494351.1 hypothetical protein BDB00DRAFT_974372 [Zychaea mexicana]
MQSRLELVRSNMMGGEGTEEKVEVNQRHLIDKILARYSAEYVLYRELMQNADDATSTTVEIQFHTGQSDPTKPNLSAKMNKITFKNNGIPFRPEDWSRLKRIAEGNPGNSWLQRNYFDQVRCVFVRTIYFSKLTKLYTDEQKIGAFGVGFYSLFSVCENPFVFSGSQCMAFYFKGDQLFAKRADVPEENRDSWTSFLMDLREPMELPNLDDFAKFLSTSMGFTANLRKITVKFDQHVIFSINKGMGEPETMTVDARKVHTSSPQRMFTITGASMRKIQLSTEKYAPPSMLSLIYNKRPVDSSSGLPMEKANIFLRVVTASLDVSVPRNFEREMERSTKKKPPKQTNFQLVYTGREELDASENNSAIFKDLIPFPNQGRVFIGFPTHQTTGCCSHMAARFIPSVERESIDFAERYLRIWNTELLAVGGLLCRIVYNSEMEQIHRLYRELVGYNDVVDKSSAATTADDAKVMLERQAAHALASFTFQNSTPSPLVGSVQEEQFFKSSKTPAMVMTSHGVQAATQTRILPEPVFNSPQLLNDFIKTIPTITPVMLQTCKDSVEKLKSFGILRTLDMNDVLKELEARPLNTSEMTACMKWWIDQNKNARIAGADILQARKRFLDAAILSTDNNDRLVALSTIKWWINPKRIPLDMPVPESVLPFSVSKSLYSADLATCFGDWCELSMVEWVRYIVDNAKELEVSATFAERTLLVVSRGYSHTSTKGQAEICKILQGKKCVPTRNGMKLPHESYFETVKLFDDLPIVRFENTKHTISDVFLAALGVRKHVELQLVFDRLISDGSWSHVDLVKYLTSVQSTLSQTEVVRLRETPIFTKEGEEPKTKTVERKTGAVDAEGKPVIEKRQKQIYRRYKAKDLYMPTENLRSLNLPLIDWKQQNGSRGNSGGWRSGSDEARFMEKLGLLSSPSVSTILTLASPETNNRQLQMRALHYFIDNHKQYEDSYHPSQIDMTFLPCSDGKTYSMPRDCFTNPDVQVLGFHALHRDLVCVRDKLGIRENPDAKRLVDAFLQKVTKDVTQAKRIFEYMASRMGDIGYEQWPKLRDVKFIPVKSHQGDTVLIEPAQCYFESGEATFHKELFLYVDFGQLANSFLRSCGVKDEPTTMELASMLVKDPSRFWNLSGGGERYLAVLRQIAGQYYHLKSNRRLLQDMKNTPFLVGIKRSQMGSGPGSDQQQLTVPAATNGITDNNNNNNDDDQKEQDEFVQYRLAQASDIFIIDDTMAQQIFSPLSAPMEPLLEEFYAHLGSDRLSRQIKETYTYSYNMGVTNRSKAVTDAIFERVPIIIYQMMSDNPQRQKELCHDEKYVKRNLKVIQAKELRINRKFKHTGEHNVQPTTACTDKSSFTIYISSMGEIDYYDIANALCALIFTRVRFNDAIVVERYLTATLTSLRRKGVPVDRILNIRKNVEKQKISPPMERSSPIHSPPSTSPIHPTLTPAQLDQCTKQVLEVFGDCQEGYVRQLLAQERENHAENVINKLLNDNDYPRNSEVKSDKEVAAQEAKNNNAHRSEGVENVPADQGGAGGLLDRIWSWRGSRQSTPTPPPPKSPIEKELPQPQTPEKQPVKKPMLPDAEETITPNYTSNVKQNLRRAIHSCKSYTDQHLFSRPQINQVAESNYYCDVKPQQNLVSSGRVKGISFYVYRDVVAEDVHQQYSGAMSRFVDIIKGLATVFELKESSLHLFYDTQGSTIAFNVNGSLFLNLRYYVALHETDDSAQSKAKRKEALIYWFMTFCHELAHNFVSGHCSEHEFYMSSFAEVYLESLMHYLAADNNSATSANPARASTVSDHSGATLI